jgi:iron(III) transport system permease protein
MERVRTSLDPHRLFVIGICGLALILTLLPMVWLFLGPSIERGEVNFEFLASALSQRRLVRALTNTIEASLATSLCATIVGAVLALLVIRTDMPFRRIVSTFTVGSFITSSYLLAFAYVLLLGPNAGVLNQALILIFRLEEAPFDIFSFGGYVFVATLEAVPLVFLTCVAALSSLDGSLENSARILGAGSMRIVVTITIPLIAPAIGAGALLAFISTLSLYGAPAILGIRVVPTEIQALLGFPARFDLAAGVSVYLMALALVGLGLYQQLLSRSGRFVTMTGKWGPAEPFRLGKFRWAVFATTVAYLVLAIVLPYAALGYASLAKAVGGDMSLENLTLDNFAFIFRDDLSMRGLQNSLMLSFGAALVASIFAAVIGFAEARGGHSWSIRLLDAFLMLPFGIPSVVIAVGLILAFIRPPLVLYGTIWIIGLAYLIKFLPIAIRILVAVFEQIDRSLEEASQIVGASPTTTFARITIPLAWNGIISAAFLVFIPCFRELGASIILASPYNETIAFAMMSAWGAVSFEVACAIGVVMLLVTFVAQMLFGRSRQVAVGVAGS